MTVTKPAAAPVRVARKNGTKTTTSDEILHEQLVIAAFTALEKALSDGTSQVALARELGLSDSTLSKSRRTRSMSVKTAERILNVLRGGLDDPERVARNKRSLERYMEARRARLAEFNRRRSLDPERDTTSFLT